MVVHRQGEAEVQAGTSVPEQTERQSKRKHTDETKRARVAKALRKIDRAKRKGRSELSLKGWQKYGFVGDRRMWSGAGVVDTMARIEYHAVSEAEFVERFERLNRPVVISSALNHWRAQDTWTLKRLRKRFGNEKFKVGEDDDGYAVKVKLKYYLRYLKAQEDDSPLYAFDSSFYEHPVKKSLLDDFEVPKYFREDLFQYVGEKRRPPYRWFVLGPPRSGTGLHIDPLGTSAWNALVFGRKHWVLFPPDTPKEALKPPRGADHEGITWFATVLPAARSASWPHHPPIEFIQQPGETVFVPGGWHHAVLNIEQTIAITQNFCSSTNFRYVWPRTVRGRPKLSKKWLKVLQSVRHDLVALANTIDPTQPDGLPLSSSSDSSSSSSSSSDHDSDHDSTAPAKSGAKSARRTKKHKLCQCEACLRKCQICAQAKAAGKPPPPH